MWKRWDVVRKSADGTRFDYDVERTLDDEGGQAKVSIATHKASGVQVAMKRLRSGYNDESLARMAREIEVGTAVASPNLVPVLDHGEDWFVMPLASCNLWDCHERVAGSSDAIDAMVRQVCGGLEVAHDAGYVHRDIKPANILCFGTKSGTDHWALADWGLVRRPAGSTTVAGRTAIGLAYGTNGYAAPELSSDAHQAGPQTDMYSLGQTIGAVLRNEHPTPYLAHLPASGPWRVVVRRLTARLPEERPRLIADVLALVDQQLSPNADLPALTIDTLIEAANRGEPTPIKKILDLVELNLDDQEIFIDSLPQLSRKGVRSIVKLSSSASHQIVSRTGWHLLNGEWGHRNFDHANSVLGLIFDFAIAAQKENELGVFEAAIESFCECEGSWNRFATQRIFRIELRRFNGDYALATASALAQFPNAAKHISEAADDRDVDKSIRRAIRGAIKI
jgi:serine/threonine protein kinase